MPYTPALIIGAGQCGLAMSRSLTERKIDHVILERGDVANSWRTERWDSLRLLTPNWQTRLPDWQYTGTDPDGYMSAGELVGYLGEYADKIDAPIHTNTSVRSVRRMGGGFAGWEVRTDDDLWFARTVVIATGACSTPDIPDVAAALPDHIDQLSPIHYRNPAQLAPGGVLVVGASASGTQLADELRRAGRDVTLAVSRHVRLPRTYRGMDIQWWLDTTGILDTRYDEVADIERARRAPSLQIVGTPDQRSVDLGLLQHQGVRLAGRVTDIDGTDVRFDDLVAERCAHADDKLSRLLDRCDAVAHQCGIEDELEPPYRPARVDAPATPATIDLDAEGISTVIWATGFRPNYPWLQERVFDERGEIRHDGGVIDAEHGLYALGLPFLRRRKSTFIDGAGADAADLADHLSNHLDRVPLVV
ncbi:MAG: FAD-dependent oxidoreductase [Acidimicrobiales bacterium]|nr:MAG: FAD-dependent oxidoreductase [Acidimicrobiales bacterium]